jgi:hypothetical protein
MVGVWALVYVGYCVYTRYRLETFAIAATQYVFIYMKKQVWEDDKLTTVTGNGNGSIGVVGKSDSAYGVMGTSNSNIGVVGDSKRGIAMDEPM